MVNILKNIQKLPKFPLWGGGIAIIGLVFIMCLLSRLGGSEKRVLFSELELTESAKVTAKLESLSIPFDVRADGQQILVNSEDVARARMSLAEEGFLTGGNVGYELFDKGETFSATSFVQNVNHTRALEGELARSITTLSPIARARVHLVMAKKTLFSADSQKTTASVVLKLKSGARLKESQIQAIQNLVAGAVPDLSADHITIVDDQGTLLTYINSGDSRNGIARNFDELRSGQEARLAQSLEMLLSKTVGAGKVRVEVSMEMDFDHFSENKEIFDPDGQVIRSQQLIEDGAHSSDTPDKTRGVTVENALPNDTSAKLNLSAGNTSQTKKTEEIFNYEISKTTRTLVRDTGVVRRLSVAVLVDGTYQKENKGGVIYKPRAVAELEQLKTLIKSAVGFKEDRGDTVEVINLRFATEELDTGTSGQTAVASQNEERDISIWIFTLLISIVLLGFFLWYFLKTKNLASYNLEEERENTQQEAFLQEEIPSTLNLEALPKDLSDKIKELIDRDPETAAAIIENWLQQEV
ncbi:MAG: flagellar M-ring protein FliF [Holosporales bacterium]|jgi:flagellar M-ring protein FliF|nr:flagellar M-ring protein FliF [Holosporales bacterium]